MTVVGRKFPLKAVREKLLKKDKKHMLLNTDAEIDSMGLEELQLMATCFQHSFDSSTMDEIKSAIKCFQRTQHLIMCHDHYSKSRLHYDDDIHCV